MAQATPADKPLTAADFYEDPTAADQFLQRKVDKHAPKVITLNNGPHRGSNDHLYL